MKTLHVIQHTSADYLGLMEDHFEGRRIRFNYFRPFTEGTPMPGSQLADGLVLLGGGPWGSAGERDIPTLQREVELAQRYLAEQRPLIGVGLGAQILSLAAGGAVESAPLRFTVGEARRVDDDALNGFLPERFPHIVYGRDQAVPPDSARVLAVDGENRPALFQVGESALGFSGHPGFKRAMAEDLIMEFEEAPDDPGAGLAALSGLHGAVEDALVPIMTGLVQVTRLMR